MKRNNRVGLSRLSIIPRGRRLVGTRTPSWRRAKNSGLIKGEVHFSKGIALQNALRIFLLLHLIYVFFFFLRNAGYGIWIISSDEGGIKGGEIFPLKIKTLEQWRISIETKIF